MSPARLNQWLLDPARPPLVMGVLNVTPDSFSDGGRFLDPGAAVAHAEAMAAEGADLIDVGGESTRPGSLPVDLAEQVRRVVPVLRALRNRLPDVAFSIDSTRADVAAAALDAGARVVNDVSAGRDDPEMLPLAARAGCPIVLMHMQGTPATMQLEPRYQDVTREVRQFLSERATVAQRAGITAERILVDPGIGFGKTVRHNLQLLRDIPLLARDGRAVVVGASRKGFIGAITGEAADGGRAFGTAATVAWSVSNGAAVVRVHDVAPMSQVVRMVQAIRGEVGEKLGDRVRPEGCGES